MRRFVWGLVFGIGLTWGYYEWDNLVGMSKQWFARASSAPNVEEKIDRMFAPEH